MLAGLLLGGFTLYIRTQWPRSSKVDVQWILSKMGEMWTFLPSSLTILSVMATAHVWWLRIFREAIWRDVRSIQGRSIRPKRKPIYS